MTCIIGFAEKKSGHVFIGGDSAGSDGWNVQIRADEKVFRNGPFLMGFTTSFRMGQLLRFSLAVPQRPEGIEDLAFMVRHFVPAVQTCLENGGWQTRDNDRKQGGTFIVGYRKKIYVIEGDYQVALVTDGIAAVGIGERIALGAMHASAHLPPKKRIMRALEVVAHLSEGVRPPFLIEELK